MIDPPLRDIIAPELADGEELLWAGRPQKRPRNTLATGYFLFGLIWLIGMCFGIFQAVTHETYLQQLPQLALFLFFSTAFLLIGATILRYGFIAMRRPARQIYGLTGQRGIILENDGNGPIRSIGLNDLGSFLRKGNKEIGSLEFESPTISSRGLTLDMYELTGIAFHNIAQPKHVEDIILQDIIGGRHDRPRT